MARIYKGSRYKLHLLIDKSNNNIIDDVSISFYVANDNTNSVLVNEGITINGNIATVEISSVLFDNFKEGLICYIVYGTRNGLSFMEERQSNYYLKVSTDTDIDIDTNDSGTTSCNLADNVYVEPSMSDADENGNIVITASDEYDGMIKTTISPIKIYDEGYDNGVDYQKGLLETCTITENGIYGNLNGWKEVNVNVPDTNGSYDEGYESGKADGYTEGANDVRNNAKVLSIIKNGDYTDTQLYKKVIVNVENSPDAYSDAYNNFNALFYFDRLSAEYDDYISNTANTSLTGYFDNSDFTEYIPTVFNYNYKTDISENNIEDIRNMATQPCTMSNFFLDCSKVKYIEGAFSGWTLLTIVAEMKNLGLAFETPQTLSFEDSPKLFSTNNYIYYRNTFINSLYDFSSGPNPNGVTTSTIKFNSNTYDYNELKTLLEQKGWTVIRN